MKKLINIKVNGDPHSVYVDTRASLLEVIRNHLGLMGTHRGCDTGNCGACTMIVDGLALNSCLLLAVDYDNSEIVTIEGVASPVEMHPLQKALVKHGGIQCGYCTPGIVMNSLVLLADNPHPTEAEIRARLSGNLCRCTGYVKIIEAVMSVANSHQEAERS